MYGVVRKFLDASQSMFGTERDCYKAHNPDLSSRTDLLHAAIMHDTGHMPFSHASEYALQSLDDLSVGGVDWEAFVEPVERRSLAKAPKLAELLSVLLILSPRFRKYYIEYVRYGEHDVRPETAPYRLCCLILGHPPKANAIGYAELISGRLIDADKLDYVRRDGIACGIPAGIDIGRLFLRSTFLDVTAAEMCRLYAEEGIPKRPTESQIHFIVNSSGKDTIEEIISARTSLYHRVYFHQTTRNAERLLEKSILAASRESQPNLDSLHLWSISDVELLARLRDSTSAEASFLAHRLISRDLLKRAMIFGSADLELVFPTRSVLTTLSSTNFEEDLRYTILPQLEKGRGDLVRGKLLDQLEQEIAIEAVRLRRLVEGEDFPVGLKQPMVAVLPIQQSPEAQDSCLVLQNEELVLSHELHNVTQTNAAEDIFKAAGYVLTDPEWRDYVYLAARKILYELTAKWVACELIINEPGRPQEATVVPRTLELRGYRALQINSERVVRRTGLNRDSIGVLENRASTKGYFDKNPTLTSRPKIDWQLYDRFGRYQGQFGWQITKELLEAYIWQFPPKFRSEALGLISRIVILDRDTVAQKIRHALEQIRAGARAGATIKVASLSPNSGAEVRMALEERYKDDDSFRKAFSVHHSLQECLDKISLESEQQLVLIDDNIVSGSQALSQLASWLGISREQWPEDIREEQNIDESQLSDVDRQKIKTLIRSARLAICVCVGASKQAGEKLSWITKKLDEAAIEGSSQDSLFEAAPVSIRIVCAEELSSQSRKPQTDFESFLSQVGAQCYAHAKYSSSYVDLSRERRRICDRNALGFGNACGTTLTYRNAPVSTYTALWCPGIFEGRPWIPLAIRRGYVKSLVLT